MSYEFVRKWYEGLPPMERKLPVLYYDGKVYSPEEILSEVERGTALGEELQRKLERLLSPHTITSLDLSEFRKVAEERAKKIISVLPKGFSIVKISKEGRVDLTPESDEFFRLAVEGEYKRLLKIFGGKR